MNFFFLAAAFVFSTATVPAQTPAHAQTPTPIQAVTPAPAPIAVPGAVVHANDMGFSYSIPSDWEVKDTAPAMPAVQQQLEKTADSQSEKKAASCVQVPLLARHDAPTSVIEIVTLGFDCFGQKFTDKDLPAFAIGVAGGLKKTFTVTDPVYGAYTLGSHSMWIERATGVPIANPETKFTLETVCAILKKGAVCWVALASDDAALQTFEHGAVTIEGDTAPALVPANALAKKPN